MSERMRRLLPTLKRINKLGDKAKKEYVKKCDREFLDCVSECAKNILRGNVQLTSEQTARLRRDKNSLRALSVKKTSLKRKRRILQKGGFLTSILGPALTALTGLTGLLLRNATR